MSVNLGQRIEHVFRYFMLKVHASHSYNGIPKIFVVDLIEILHHSVGRVGAGIAKEILAIIVYDFLLNQIFMFPKFLLEFSILFSLGGTLNFLILILIIKILILIQFILVELFILLDLLRSGTIFELTESIVNYFDLNNIKVTS